MDLFSPEQTWRKTFGHLGGNSSGEGKLILFTDMDQSTPISEFSKMLPFLKTGQRWLLAAGDWKEKISRFLENWLPLFFRTFRGIFVLPEIVDTQAGFKAFSKEAVFESFSQTGSC